MYTLWDLENALFLEKVPKVLEETWSVDETKEIPTLIEARYILKNNMVYLQKDNGTEERVGSVEYWNKIGKFKPYKQATLNAATVHKHEILSCGLCEQHKNSTALYNIVPTNRCNLKCWFCFFYPEKVGYVYEEGLEGIRKMIESAKRVNGYTPPVQITGGEPTLREDLPEIIKLCKEMGSPHVQLNTNSVKIGIEYYSSPEAAIKEVGSWKEAGLNTIYTSFDGVNPEINFKNHYEIPFALEAYSNGDIKSVVLVPTVFRENLEEIPKIVKFAAMHTDKGVRGVNCQPISIVGGAASKEREKLRVAQSDIVDELKVLGIKMDDYYPIPAVQILADVIGGKKNHVHFYNSEKCGLATYVYAYEGRLHPITEFVDVDKFLEDLNNTDRSTLHKVAFYLSIMPDVVRTRDVKRALAKNIDKYVIQNELPDGTRLLDVLGEVMERGEYPNLGKFHEHFLFIGMMHFMDPYNYDVNRVQRCCIHYGSPDGRVIPFCTYNVFPRIYRDAILEANKIKNKTLEEKLKEEEKKAVANVRGFRRRIDEIKESGIYKSYYRGLV